MTPGNDESDLSVSIVNTNNRDIVANCLKSIQQSTHRISFEIFVVDNASTDGSEELIRAEFPEVKLILNDAKRGFSTNHNKALAQAQGRYLMILNDDVIVLDGAFDQLVAFMDEHPEGGVVGPKFLNPDGTNQPAFARFGTPFYDLVVRSWQRRFKPGSWDLDQTTEVDSIGGACMLVRREAVEQVGLLDTAFDPLYSEEREWCYRIREQGWRIYHVPQAQIIHLGGQTRKRTPELWTKVIYQHKLLFFQKHHSAWHVLCYRSLLAILSLGRMAYWGILWLLKPATREMSLRRLVCHWEVGTQTALGLAKTLGNDVK
jgi:GT2 family glycosyltransferase